MGHYEDSPAISVHEFYMEYNEYFKFYINLSGLAGRQLTAADLWCTASSNWAEWQCGDARHYHRVPGVSRRWLWHANTRLHQGNSQDGERAAGPGCPEVLSETHTGTLATTGSSESQATDSRGTGNIILYFVVLANSSITNWKFVHIFIPCAIYIYLSVDNPHPNNPTTPYDQQRKFYSLQSANWCISRKEPFQQYTVKMGFHIYFVNCEIKWPIYFWNIQWFGLFTLQHWTTVTQKYKFIYLCIVRTPSLAMDICLESADISLGITVFPFELCQSHLAYCKTRNVGGYYIWRY